MINIIKSQNYQLRHDLFTIIALIICVILPVILIASDASDAVEGGMIFVYHSEVFALAWVFVSLVFCGRITGWDFNDKTINYELLSGHSRSDVFWGRFATCLIWICLISFLMLLVPLSVQTMLNGWGYNVEFLDMMLRILLSIFPLIRIVAEFFLLSLLLRNCYVTYAVGYFAFAGCMVISLLVDEFLGIDSTYMLGYATISNLFELSNYHSEMINGVDVNIYNAALEGKDIVSTIVSSVVVTGICIIVGRKIFKNRDMQ